VSVGQPADPAVAQALGSRGYMVTHAAAPAELQAGVGRERGRAAVFLMTVGPDALGSLIAEASAAFTGQPVRLVVLAPQGQDVARSVESAWLHPGPVLCLRDGTDVSEQASCLVRFLEGDGCQWASDFPASALRTQLLAGVGAPGRPDAGLTPRVHEFARGLSEYTELGAMLEAALHRCLETIHCGAGSIYLWDEGSETLILRAAEGPDREERLGLRQKLGEGLAGWVAERREPLLVVDTRKVHWLRGRQCRRYSSVSCVASPITHGGQFFGVICLTMPEEDRPFKPEDLQLLQALSQRLGALARPLSLMAELRRFNERLMQAYRSCTDMVEEKDTQLRALRVLSLDILNGVPLGVIAYDRQLRICFANSAAERMFGELDAGPFGEGAGPLEKALDVEPQKRQEMLRRVIEKGEALRLDRVPCRSEAGTRILAVRGAPLYGSDGASIGCVLTAEDVTEDVELEAKLSAAQRLAVMGHLAAKVAHEINNPLDGILRFVGLAMRRLESDPDRARAYLEESRRGLLRMSNIVGQLLAFSRRHHGAHEPVSITQVLQDALAVYDERARAADARVQVDVPPDLPACSSPELYEVFGNIIKNALDAMENADRERLLTVRASQEDGQVKVTFADTGPGVPPHLADSIFEPFFTTKADGAGTGLGLATCRDALSRMGGSIRLCPSGTGATFEIVVPVESMETRRESDA